MKKLLFSLVAAGACGGVIAAPGIATFENYGENAFSVELKDDGTAVGNDSGYWSINMTSDPELTLTAYESPAQGNAKYLQINTGSTPLWRTFGGVNAADAIAGTIPAGESADGKIVSSKVKLTACTEWPDLTDFAAKGDDPGEKLALFLFVKEEGDTTQNPNGLYAVGGKQTENNGWQPEAYLLTGATVTAGDWVTVTIKTYGDINKDSSAEKLPGFVVAVNNTVLKRSVETGLSNDDLNPTVAARNTIGSEAVNGTLIPAIAYTTSANLQGLGFQGEGGIDDVNLAASEVNGMADAIAFTVAGNGAGKATFGDNLKPDQNNVITVPASDTSVSFTLTLAANEVATVTYMLDGDDVGNLAKNGDTYTFAPVANATLTITVETLLYQANGKGYATFAEALTAALAEGADGTVTLLGNVDAPIAGFEIAAGKTVIINLAGNKVTATKDCAFRNKGTLTITDTTTEKKGEVCAFGNDTTKDAVRNDEGATLYIEAGKFTGMIRTNEEGEDADYTGTATITGGAFSDDTVAKLTPPTGKKWELGTDSYYTLVDAAGNTPTVGAGEGSVEVDSTTGDAEIKPADGKTEVTVTIPNGFTGNIIVPSTVTTVKGGVPAEKLGVKIGEYTVIGAFKINETSYAIELDKDATVKVGNEDIQVEPELATVAADGETAVDPFVAGDKPAATVKTIPGLKYSLIWDADVGGSFGNVAVQPTQATSSRMTLEDETDKTNVTKRFYKVKVTK